MGKEITMKLYGLLAKSMSQEMYTVQNIELSMCIAYVLYHHSSPEFKNLEQKLGIFARALQNASDEPLRLELATEFIKLWFKGTDEDVQAIFGNGVKLRSVGKGMITLTGDQTQVRVWFRTHNFGFGFNHVDSCGEDLLLSVRAHPEVTQKYLKIFLEITGYTESEHRENGGVRIFR